MDTPSATLLIVDDEPFNLEIIEDHLENEGYALVSATDSAEAWAHLEATPQRFDVVLLDRMMPGMDGLEVLARIKAHPQLRALPVIMQTARAAAEDMVDGVKAGAFYYLTKPYDAEMLRSIVRAAVDDRRRYQSLQQEIRRNASTIALMHSGCFRFRSLDEARDLAAVVANAFPDPARVVTGLAEIMINAVEHGNLGISYEDKSQLLRTGTWEQEVRRRLALPENAPKQAELSFTRSDGEVQVTIRDQGKGFDWKAFAEIDPGRVYDTHGRGIAMSRLLSFDHLEYRGVGNEAVAVVRCGGGQGR